MRKLFFLLAALLLAGRLLAEDFWATKEYMQWSDDEVKKVMTNSPWAKDVTVNAPLALVGGRGQRGVAQAAPTADVENTGGGGGGRGRRGGGGSAAGGGAAPTEAILTMNMSWRSALPLRKALVRSRLGASAAVPPEAQQLISKDQEDYVIVLSGVPAGLARLLQDPAVLEKSTIRAGKRPPISAKGVDVQRRTQTVDVIFAFPKTQLISPEDKDIEVVLKLGQIEAKKKFNLKEMVYNGKLEM